MPFIPVPSTLQANIRFVLAGEQVENVMYFSWVGGDFAAAVDAVYGTLDLVWWATLRAYITNRMAHEEVYFVDMESETAAVETRPAFENPAGAVSGEGIPNNCAFCITHRTALRGRSYRGRTYVGGLAQSAVDGNTVDGAAVTNSVLAFNAMRTTLEADDVAFVIVSRYHNNAPRVEGLRTPVNLSLAIDGTIDSQRRRLPGRGR
jgi:hypothetical protein